MRVLLVSSFLYPRGGDTTCAFTGARALTTLGHEVVPLAMRHPENAPSPWERWFAPPRGIGRWTVPDALGAIWSPGAADALRRLIDHHRPDVAWINHLHRHLSPSILPVLREAGVRVVWTLHDYELVCANGLLYTQGAFCRACRGGHWEQAIVHRCKHDDFAQSAWAALEKTVHGWAGVRELVDRFVTPSAFLARELLANGFDADRVVHVPNPIEEITPGTGGPGWLVAGRLTPEKGIDDAIAAARITPGLTLVGPGAPPDLPPGVTSLGLRTHAETLDLVRQAGVVVVPSRWPENQPYAVVEAQLAGRPVVATRVGGVPELIEDGVTGRLVDPGQPEALAAAIAEILRDPVLGDRLGRAARDRVHREHDPTVWARRMTAIFGA